MVHEHDWSLTVLHYAIEGENYDILRYSCIGESCNEKRYFSVTRPDLRKRKLTDESADYYEKIYFEKELGVSPV